MLKVLLGSRISFQLPYHYTKVTDHVAEKRIFGASLIYFRKTSSYMTIYHFYKMGVHCFVVRTTNSTSMTTAR